jgi:hypothetical protein
MGSGKAQVTVGTPPLTLTADMPRSATVMYSSEKLRPGPTAVPYEVGHVKSTTVHSYSRQESASRERKADSLPVGRAVGRPVGENVGSAVVGSSVGVDVGLRVMGASTLMLGFAVGEAEGKLDGSADGWALGDAVGTAVGSPTVTAARVAQQRLVAAGLTGECG